MTSGSSPPAYTLIDHHPSSARLCSTASSGYPLVCPVTAVGPASPPSAPDKQPDLHKPDTLTHTDLHTLTHSDLHTLTHSDSHTPAAAPPRPSLRAYRSLFHSLSVREERDPASSRQLDTAETETETPLPVFNLPTFVAPNSPNPLSAQRPLVSFVAFSPPAKQEAFVSSPLDPSPLQSLTTAPSTVPPLRRTQQPPKDSARVITLAELERRLSLASLPDGTRAYNSLVRSAALKRAFAEDKQQSESADDRKSKDQFLRRRHSADSRGMNSGWWDTLSSLGRRDSPPARARTRPPAKNREHTRRGRDDVTTDWSSVISTEESVSYYAVKKRGRGINLKRARGQAASLYHPPPVDALAPRYPAPIYGNMVPTLNASDALALTPVASRSLLTCSNDFKKQYPFVYQGLCKGLLDIQRLIAHEIVVPIKEDISLRRSTIRSRKAVTSAICDQLWRSLQGKFPDPSIAPKLIRKMADCFYDKIEYGIQDAEDERSFLQWLFRFDVENAIDLRQNATIHAGKNSVLCNVEGSAHLKRRKGDFFNMVSPDVLTLNLEWVIKALFLNGGHLVEINSDTRFIDRVSAGENRFAQNFLMM